MNKLMSLEQVETFIRQNRHTFGADKAVEIAKQLAGTMRDNERLREAINLTLDAVAAYPSSEHPMTASEVILRNAILGYRNKHPVIITRVLTGEVEIPTQP